MKDYERITHRLPNGEICTMETKFDSKDALDKALYRLAKLEDKIENGTLIELPCEIGAEFYYIGEDALYSKVVVEANVSEISIYKSYNSYKFIIYDIDGNEHNLEHIFFTKDDAEAILKRLQEEENYDRTHNY